jgi:hypothetical protein
MTDDYANVVRDSQVTVAERTGQILGLIVLGVDAEGFVVDKSRSIRRIGEVESGGRCSSSRRREARGTGFDSIYLYTHEKMIENLALYERIGYVEYDRRPVGAAGLVYLRKQLR